MTTNIAIKVENLGKRYRMGQYVGSGAQYKTLRESLTNAVSAPFRRLRYSKLANPQSHILTNTTNGTNQTNETRHRTPHSSPFLWALRDVSFEVKRGEVLGVIGRNGAGKSTLLKILTRITEPTEGRAELHGRVGSLLEVGTGFHPELTGRENVYLSGAILGMLRKEIDRKFDEIVDFSGVEKYIDTPVKRYSSGMRVRLGFAVAAHLEPEILLIDEVLAVGDAEFQKKCLGKMGDVAKEGRTVLFVSHNMVAIRNLCPRTLLLDNGGLVSDTDTERAIVQYLDRNLAEGALVSCKELEGKVEGVINRNNPSIRLKEIALVDQQGLPCNTFQSDEGVRVSVTYECLTVVIDLRVIVQIVDDENRPILTTQNVDDSDGERFYRREPGVYKSSCLIPPNTFGEKRFYVSVELVYPKVEHLVLKKILGFEVAFQGYNNVQYGSWKDSFLRPRLRWNTKPIDAHGEDTRG